MRMRRPDRRVCRAVVAVTALYALALQAVLGGGTIVRTFDPAHVLCLQAAGADAPAGAPPHRAHHRAHLACCTAAQVLPALDIPLPAAVARAGPVRLAVPAVRRIGIVAGPRAPPGTGTGARAPPVA